MHTKPAAIAAAQIAATVAWLNQMPKLPVRHHDDAVFETVQTGIGYTMEQHPEIEEHAAALREQLEAIDPAFAEDVRFWTAVADSIEAA